MSEHQGLTCCLSSVCCNSDALIQAGPRLQAGCMVLFRIDGIHLLQRRVKPDKTLRLHIMASMSQTNGADCRPSVGCLPPPIHSNLCTAIYGRQRRFRHTSRARAVEAVLGSRPSATDTQGVVAA